MIECKRRSARTASEPSPQFSRLTPFGEVPGEADSRLPIIIFVSSGVFCGFYFFLHRLSCFHHSTFGIRLPSRSLAAKAGHS